MTSNAQAILKRMQARSTAIQRELQLSARILAPKVAAESKQIIQAQIYDVPIPLKAAADKRLSAKAAVRAKTTKGSNGKWMRTGNLKRGETASPDGVDVLLTNNANYSAARNALGGPATINPSGRRAGVQRPQPRTPDAQKSRTRSVQWQSEAIANKREEILQIRREGVLRAMASP